jgi:hypothetical protein
VETERPPVAPLNYFNYFTEVEEEFVRRRGKPLLISPMDWALVESWKSSGIPLHVVLRAINQTFDAAEARPRRFRKVNSVLYCQQEVEACFAEYRLAQVGDHIASDEKSQPDETTTGKKAGGKQSFTPDVLLDFIARCDKDLGSAAEKAGHEGFTQLVEAISRVRDRLESVVREISSADRIEPEAIEHDFDSMDRLILEAATGSMSPDTVLQIREEAESQLRPFKKKMDKSIYNQALENFVMRRVREVNGLPRLSLFYL